MSIINIKRINTEQIKNDKDQEGSEENPFPSYDISTTRGMVFKTPRYDTNSLEFLRQQAHKNMPQKRGGRNIDRVKV